MAAGAYRAVIAAASTMFRCPGPSVKTPAQSRDFPRAGGRRRRARRAAPRGARRRARTAATAAAGSCSPPATGPSGSGRSRPTGRSSGDPGLKGWVAYPLKRRAPAVPALVRRAARRRAADVQRRRAEDGRRDPRGGRPRRGARAEQAADDSAELEERLLRDERRAPRPGSAAAAPATVAAQPAAAAVPDYFAFEARMRGSTADVRERQRPYVDDFRDAAPVLDVGCGRGELLGPPPRRRDRGARGRRRRRHGRLRAAARASTSSRPTRSRTWRRSRTARSAGSSPARSSSTSRRPALFRLLELAARKLRPGGLLVAETINPLSPLALRSYFADLTHAQPLVPETLALLARQAGLPRGRDPLPERAAPRGRRGRADPRDPLRAARLRDRRQNLRIAVCRPQVAFARGGVEIFTDDLVEELRAPRPRRRPRQRAVQVVSGRARPHPGVPLAPARPRRGGRPADRARDRDQVPVVRRPPSEQGRLARPPVPPGVRARPHRARPVRRVAGGPGDPAQASRSSTGSRSARRGRSSRPRATSPTGSSARPGSPPR